jgi:hypothetical protein
LLLAAIQFVALTAIAMAFYSGGSMLDRSAHGYTFSANFLSDLGATQSWSGEPNHISAVLFSCALAGIGAAFVAFAGTWRAFAFGLGRARLVGFGAEFCGTLAGVAFFGVALTPVDVAMDLHNGLVMAAFGLLLAYACCLALALWLNEAERSMIVASATYVVMVGAYVTVTVTTARHGIDHDDWRLMVLAQKAIAVVSMLYIVYVTVVLRRQLADEPAEA